jgi:hypothetical protein
MTEELAECCLFRKKIDKNKIYCDHRENPDFRSRGKKVMHKARHPKRCLPEYCPLKKSPLLNGGLDI